MRSLLIAIVVLAGSPAAALAAPSVTISSAPAASVVSTEATFTFAVAGTTGPLTVQCALDGVISADCTSPKAYAGLGIGDHVFEVTVRESRTGTGAGARHAWSIVAAGTGPSPPDPTSPLVPLTDPALPVPAAQLDLDADRVPDADDPCPAGSRGRASIVRGCSMTDALARPHVLLGPLAEKVARARSSLNRFSGLRTEGARAGLLLGRGLQMSTLALARLDEGSPCAARAPAARALVLARRAAGGLGHAQARLVRRVTRRQRGGDGSDVGARDSQILAARVSLALVRDAVASLVRLRGALGALCSSAAPRTVSGRVAVLDDAAQTARLEGGRVVHLGALQRESAIAKGVRVTAKGQRLQAAVLAQDVSSAGVTKLPAGFTFKGCLDLRVAPDQLPVGKVLHDIGGYSEGLVVHLEQASRLGVEAPATPCPPKIGPQTLHYGMTIILKYTRTGGGTTTAVLAQSLEPGPLRVALPADVSPKKPATLIAKVRARRCTPKFPAGIEELPNTEVCDAPKTIDTMSYVARVHEPGYYGQVFYDPNIFAIEDDDLAGFAPATINDFQPLHSIASDGYVIEGLGHPAVAGPDSSSVVVIPFGGTFAVRSAFGSYAPPDEAFTGPAGGLLKARIHGTRNGHPFWYSIERDWVTTDATTLCSPINSFYRFPWAKDKAITMGQGNNGSLTHNGAQQFAFDFRHPPLTPIHAARGGRVISVVENLSKTSDPNAVKAGLIPAAPANALVVLHMDGTLSAYFHMVKNGVVPAVGDTVHRGDVVAYSGNTGNSTNPHLHFHAVTQIDTDTHPIRFDGFSLSQPGGTCFVPVKGEILISTNG